MIPSPDGKPLSELTVEELKRMEKTVNKNVTFSAQDIDEELRYREQRSIAESMRKIVKIQAVIAGTAVFVGVAVAVTNVL